MLEDREVERLNLRPATPADLAGVAAVFSACWQDAYREVVAPEVLARFDLEGSIELWRPLLGGGGQAVVAEGEGGRVIGVVRFGRDPEAAERGHVFSLYVDPRAAAGGVGGALLDAAGEWFRAEGLDSATLWVFEGNHHARGFYERRGWLPDGARRVEPEFGAQEMRLRRILGA